MNSLFVTRITDPGRALSPLEQEIRNLIREGRKQVKQRTLDREETKALIKRLKRCAERATEAGFVFSARELSQVIEDLRRVN